MLDRPKTAQILQLIDFDMPVVDLIAAPAQQIADHVLARTLGAARRRNGDELFCRRKLRVEAGVDRVENFAFGIVGVHVSPLLLARDQSTFFAACRRLSPATRIADPSL